ncbi:hypothetical protein BH10ACT10_BH10ACT10_16730 [soil metagenome]
MVHRKRLWGLGASAAVVTATMLGIPSQAPAIGAPSAPTTARGSSDGVKHVGPLSQAKRHELRKIARRSWKFYADDIDPTTHLPLDNLTYAGGSRTPTDRGTYTSSANIGQYMWALVSASDLGLITKGEATRMARQTLRTVSHLDQYHGFLYQWYNTDNGHVLVNPGQGECATTGGTFDNCSFVSNVDNGLYASGLVVARQALPGVRHLATELSDRMDFSLFYDARPETHCNVNRDITGNQPTGQMYGGYYKGSPPDQGDNYQHYYHNGALYSDPRISAYLGLGRHEMPGNVWWRSWRELPPPAPFQDCQDDPDFSWQGQWPMDGSWKTIKDPQSGKKFPVWEGAYTYPGTNIKFIPTFGGGMFEALMVNQVVPETSWGPHSFGLADQRTVTMQRRYATRKLGYPVWGMSPSSTADDSGGYSTYGAAGNQFPYHGVGATEADPNLRLAQCQPNCTGEDVVTPHASFIALDPAPRVAYANIMKMKQMFPDVYGSRGFYDALNPTTGAVGHRILVLDQSMIMASIDNALRDRALQRHFAADRVSAEARRYLGLERMNL